MKLWTAQYNYSGVDRLDITYKSYEAMRLATPGVNPLVFEASWVKPTKEMVQGYKYGWKELDEHGKQVRYTYMYNEIMKKAWSEHLDDMFRFVQEWPTEMTVVCYCKSGHFCHRLLLVHYLEQLGAQYMGERT